MVVLYTIYLLLCGYSSRAVQQSYGANNEVRNWPQDLNSHINFQRHKSAETSPYWHVLCQHLPKTGGGSMRFALERLAQSRNTKIQVCYDDVHCSSPVNYGLSITEGVVPFNPNESLPIVTGHGLKRGFDEVWNLENVAWIAVMRDPIYLAISLWNHEARTPSSGLYGITFDSWVDRGRTELMVDNIVSYFLKIEGESPKNNEMWQAALRKAVNSPNVLVLEHGKWNKAVAQMTPFLNLTRTEAREFEDYLIATDHHSPNTTNYLHLQKDNRDRFENALGLLSFLYYKVLGGHAANSLEVANLNGYDTLVKYTVEQDGDEQEPTFWWR